MALSARDVLLILRAQDQASKVISNVSSSFAGLDKATKSAAMQQIGLGAVLAAVGVGLVAVGKKGFDFFSDARTAAMGYTQDAALTLTQVDRLGVSLDTIKSIGRDVAKAIPAPFDQMQKALFDIFSSMDVNTSQAQDLLTAFAKGAVAGQTDIQTAGRASIAIMNAYKIPVSEVNSVMDQQFQLVRKGVGTYQEFATAIGRAIPPAVATNQSLQTLDGTLAFLTRNGLSADQAATSAGRAFELLAKPDVTAALQKMGVQVTDSSGNFRQMNDIITQLAVNKGWAKMTGPELAKAFKDTFGTGSIQARRFFDLAIPNWEQYNGLVGDMFNASGSASAAYDIMFAQPQSQSQLLSNNIAVLKTMIGDELVPVFQKITAEAIKLVQWFENLSPHTRHLIVMFGIIASIALIVAGIILVVVGSFLILGGILALVGTTFGAVAFTIGIVIGVILTLIVVGILIWKNWDTIKSAAEATWGFVRDKAQEAWQLIQQFWSWLSSNATSIWDTVSSAAVSAWDAITGAAQRIWDKITEFWNWFSSTFGPGFSKIWDAIKTQVVAIVDELVQTVSPWWDMLVQLLTDMVQWGKDINDIWTSVLNWIISNVVGPMVDFLSKAFIIMSTIVETAMAQIQLIITTVMTIIETVWSAVWPAISTVIGIVWNEISTVIASVITIIGNIIQLFLNLLQGDWSGAWENVKNILSAAWDAIKASVMVGIGMVQTMIAALGPKILELVSDFPGLLLWAGLALLNGLKNGAIAGAEALWGWLRSIGGAVAGIFWDAGSWLWDVGVRIIQGIIDGVQSMAGKVGGAVSGILKSIPGASFLGSMGVPGFAIGGIINHPMLAHVGEAGPEVIIPLNNAARAMQLIQQSGLINLMQPQALSMPVAMAAIAPAVTGSNTINAQFNINGAQDPKAISTEIDMKLNELLNEMTARGMP